MLEFNSFEERKGIARKLLLQFILMPTMIALFFGGCKTVFEGGMVIAG